MSNKSVSLYYNVEYIFHTNTGELYLYKIIRGKNFEEGKSYYRTSAKGRWKRTKKDLE